MPLINLPYLLLLFNLAQHDNTLHLLFPHHPPEVIDSVWEGTLSCYVGSLLPVTLQVIQKMNTLGVDSEEVQRICGGHIHWHIHFSMIKLHKSRRLSWVDTGGRGTFLEVKLFVSPTVSPIRRFTFQCKAIARRKNV